MSCVVGHRHSSDLMLLCLWCRPAAVALTGPLAWEPPYASGVALRTKQTKQGVPVVVQSVKILPGICEDAASIPGLTQWVKDLELP